MTGNHHLDRRRHLDILFLFDALFSVAFGAFALLVPHGIVQNIGGGEIVETFDIVTVDLGSYF